MDDQFNKDIIDGLLHKLPKEKKKTDDKKSSDDSGTTSPSTAPTPMPGGTDVWAPIRPLTPLEKSD
jgi:hypothetical protein